MKKRVSWASAACLALGVAGWASSASAQCIGYTITQTNDGVVAAGGTDIGNHGDDVTTSAVALPFPVNFYGTNYTTINLCSNGHAQFTTSSTSFSNAALPTATFTGPTIMPLWDDLRTDGTGQGIVTSTEGVSPTRIFHIVWTTGFFSGFTGTANFELRFTEGSNDFDIVYGAVASGGQSATIGCEQGGAAGAATQFSYNPVAPGPLTSGLRLHFTQNNNTQPPIVTASVAPTCGAPSTAFTITATITSPGCPAQTFVSGSANCAAIGAGTVTLAGTGPYTGSGTVGVAAPGTYSLPVAIVMSGGTVNTSVSFVVPGGVDDAGDTLATARVMTGGAITSIAGVLDDMTCSHLSDADVIKVGICDPANFSATTVGGTTMDTQLFLFNKFGVGVEMNDDAPAGTLQSNLTNAFTSSLPPGNYYLAISSYNKDPLDSTAALIWANTPFNTVRAPDGPSVSHVLDHWDTGGGYTGAYTIALTGVCGVLPECHGQCVADFDDGSGTGTPDGGVTIDDLLYYLFIFDQGLICADVDDGTGTGTPDGGVTIDDLLYYLARFDAGC